MSFIENIEPMAFYVAFTFVIALLFTNFKNQDHFYLFLIVSVSFLTEIASVILSYKKYEIDLIYSISMTIHNGLWITVLTKSFFDKRTVFLLLTAFLSFSCINFFFIEGIDECNFNTFIVGSLLYVILFIYESFYQLKKENLSFFTSNVYFLRFTPVLFFLGLSFIFGFKSDELAKTIVFNKIRLYPFINNFSNLVYYTLINIYIYREKRVKNAG